MSFKANDTGCRPPRSSENFLSLHLRLPARKASKEILQVFAAQYAQHWLSFVRLNV